MTFLLYGANGFSGELIARHAKDNGLTPILAGRSKEKIKPLAEELGLEYVTFDLHDSRGMNLALRRVPLILHAAGPFIHTARPMMEGCLRNGVHYLDITGEIPVFEMAAGLNERALEAGIMMMPGTGFDVVPTDCIALYLKKKLPDATDLKIAFTNVGSRVSHGTAKTMIENLGRPGAVRKDGKIKQVPLGHKTRWVPFPEKERFCMTIPWGDVSTAYYTTGIPNIKTYTSVAPKSYRYIELQRYFGWLLRTSLVRNFLKSRIERKPAGPSGQERREGRSQVWGRVENEAGEYREARMEGPESYDMTMRTSLLIARKVLEGKAPLGFQTPAGAYGEDLVMEIKGVRREDLVD
jgi:short subunit dehydrogenase-like uncharacterized protein